MRIRPLPLALVTLLAGDVAADRGAPICPAVFEQTFRVRDVELRSAARGLSGLALDRVGRIWAVAERDRRLLQVDLRRRRVGPRGLRIEGLSARTDTEALAWIDRRTFVVGTESHGDGKPAAIVTLRVRGSVARPQGAPVAFPYERFAGIERRDNRGIEGLCAAGQGRLVAAFEQPVVHEGQRLAPLAVHSRETGRWRPFLLRLASSTGKLAGIACRAGAAGRITAVAIERHFGTMKLLCFSIPATAAATPPRLRPLAIVDLSRRLSPLPNLEGIVWRGPRLVLVSDNDYGGHLDRTRAVELSPVR